MKRTEKIQVGMVFGRLTVIEAYSGKSSNNHSMHRCRCECGKGGRHVR